MRGQQIDNAPSKRRKRIIPARAGPTLIGSTAVIFLTDHPRSCGANASVVVPRKSADGSSPLVRGQHSSATPSSQQLRIIPARAGPTSCFISESSISADHPRSCGANGGYLENIIRIAGSSPLVRGQPFGNSILYKIYRIIPARAGPTGPTHRKRLLHEDHPRSCGANYLSSTITTIEGDHPRSCGANGISATVVIYGFRSSPLVRGQQNLGRYRCHLWPIIPARAGPTV